MLLLLLLRRFSRVRLCATPETAAHQAPHPWDSPGQNTGVGCHFLLQCVKVKSESEVTQSCLTLSDPMVCRPPGSSVHGIFQAGVLERVALPSPKGTLEPSYTDTNGFKFFSWKSNRPQGMPGMWDRTGLLRAYLDQGRHASNISGITISTYWPNN